MQAKQFRQAFAPVILQMEFRLAELEILSGNTAFNSVRWQTAKQRLTS
jgi:ketosteroid isomerase-like protein